MALSYGKSSPGDLLAKARRDLERLKKAESAEHAKVMSDALFDLAVVLTGLKDWLAKHPGAPYTRKDVENYWAASVALSTFRDIANAGKHRTITKYVPPTADALTSAPSSPLTVLETIAKKVGRGKKYPRLKVIRADGSRHRAIDLGEAALSECTSFMSKHGVT
jgi:hypothetical protein